MTRAKPIILLALLAAVGLSACSRKDVPLMNLRAGSAGPDEFSILPTKPLKMPKNFAQLPEPTPGGPNLVDPTPNADAVAALGGNPKYLRAKGIPRGDRALVASAGRYGVAPDIRTRLSTEDREFRRTHPPRVLERWFRLTTYFKVYAPMALDRYAELERMRRAGVRTPEAPPKDYAALQAIAARKAKKKLRKPAY